METAKPEVFKDEYRIRVLTHIKDKIMNFEWNSNLTCPIIPTAHGTDFFLAQKIGQTGFANLSTLDDGWFGKGIYFSTSIKYCEPYYLSKRSPVIIISYVLLGEVYPVREQHIAEDSLIGRSIMPGYNSHYVCTTASGVCCPTLADFKNCYDEVIVAQEAQIIPAFFLKLAPKRLVI